MTLVPWEATLSPHIPWTWRTKSVLLNLVCRKYKEILLAEEMVLCDLVAAAVLLDETLITKKHTMGARVLLQSQDAGTVLFDW